MNSNATIVTACDKKYVWGAYLLIASVRYAGMDTTIIVSAYDLDQNEIAFLEQFPNVTVFSSGKMTSRSVCTQKPTAISLAETDYVTWMDADCIVTGNISSYLEPGTKKMLIRFRNRAENATVFRDRYSKDSHYGDIPETVLEIWRRDIDELPEPRFATVCETNCFTLHRQDIPFINRWKDQMDKVIPDNIKGVYNKKSIAYFMTDESVLNSMLEFSREIPDIGDYPYNLNESAYVAHFGYKPKPWQHWNRRSIRYYLLIQNIIQWTLESGYELLPLPPSLRRKHRHLHFGAAHIRSAVAGLRHTIVTAIKKIGLQS